MSSLKPAMAHQVGPAQLDRTVCRTTVVRLYEVRPLNPFMRSTEESELLLPNAK